MWDDAIIWFLLAFYLFSLAVLYAEHRHRLLGQELAHRRELDDLGERLRRIESRLAMIEETTIRC